MNNTTEQKFLDAALKIFAQKGYKGATTMLIAEEAGFSEKTLFRKFKTKKNLYNMVLISNAEKFKEYVGESVFVDRDFDNSEEFLDHYIRNLAQGFLDNFEFFNLSINEPNEVLESIMENTVDFIEAYLEKNIPNSNLDHKIFGLSISSFLYTICIEKYMGRTYLDFDDTLNRFIKHCTQIVLKF
jgi:TetR/AcrR family transcriptional regulator